MTKPIRIFAFLLLGSLLLNLACRSTSDRVSEAVQEATQVAATEPSAAEPPAAKPEAAASPTPAPTQPRPTATPKEEALPITLVDYGFAQGSIQVTIAFLVGNPNQTYAIEDSTYSITAYDDAGVVLATDSGYINLVLPGEKLGVAADVFLEEGQKAAKVDVQVSSGSPQPISIQGPLFTTEQVQFIPDDWGDKVTGLVTNGFQRNINDLRVTGVLYDEAGKIVGGGYTYLNFLNAGDQTGVDVDVVVSGKPVTAELYLALSGLSVLEEASAEPPSLQLVSYGYGINGQTAAVAFLVKNFDDQMTYTRTQYQVSAFDADGNVLVAGEGYLGDVYPGEQSAGYEGLLVPEGKVVDHVEVNLSPGDKVASELDASPLASGRLVYWPSEYFPKLSGVISNTHTLSVHNLDVTAVAYDESGEIVGGGEGMLYFIPEKGVSPVNFSLDFGGSPVRFELYPALNSMSSFEQPLSEQASRLVAQGEVKNDNDYVVGFIVENTDPKLPILSGTYQVAAYDEAGNVLDVDSSYLPLIFPASRTAMSVDLRLPDGTTPARVDIQVSTDAPKAGKVAVSPFTVLQADYLPGSYSNKVTGTIQSAYGEELTYVAVTAILYNEAGEIIGSGRSYIDKLPANGQGQVEISVTNLAPPAKVELFVSFSGW